MLPNEGPLCPHKKKKKKMLRNYPTAFSPTGGLVATQEKKNAKKLGNIRKVSKPHKLIAQRPAPPSTKLTL